MIHFNEGVIRSEPARDVQAISSVAVHASGEVPTLIRPTMACVKLYRVSIVGQAASYVETEILITNLACIRKGKPLAGSPVTWKQLQLSSCSGGSIWHVEAQVIWSSNSSYGPARINLPRLV